MAAKRVPPRRIPIILVDMKLPRRRWWILAASSALVALALAGWWFAPDSENQITREKYQRIRMGMTPAEVQAVIGCKPMPAPPSYPEDYEMLHSDCATWPEMPLSTFQAHWASDGNWIYVVYNSGKVQYKSFQVYVGLPSWKVCAAPLE
jgi:hypothetical protein